MGYIRAGLIAAFAIMFGIVQLICACMPVASGGIMAAHPSFATDHMSSHDMNQMANNDASPPNHGQHEHKAKCSHCDDTVALSVILDTTPYVYNVPTIYVARYSLPAPRVYAFVADINRSGLRWHNPPRPLSSPGPVKLQTRSLI
ncbi:DUF2946 family protein [Robiginitomaculum antarcticum]|uniref:DUF2946 family protein n=1 Tax=Robiginitomaculum antarcticum TaxID=437507 RepID=UPI00035FC7CF|nr:DUF2946 family protein [Robiginitomaculum antarcticum]